MGVLRNELKSNFTQIPNQLLFDIRLSFGARILFCYLASKPDNWKIINQDIITNLQISSDSVAKYFKELLDAGWITREREIDTKGQYCGGYDYTIYSNPKNSLLGKSPNPEKVLIRKVSGNNNNTNTINNTNTTNNTNNDIVRASVLFPTKKTDFIKPNIAEIEMYCSTEKINVDAKQFYYFYESKGWMIGKNKMKSWKAALRTWERKSKTNNVANEFLELGREK